MKKKKILFHSNHSKAFTGFGKNAKNILKHLYKTGKYEIVEFANGFQWSNPKLKKMPWKTYGSLPDDPALIQQLNSDPQLGRAAGYGANMIDKIIEQEKPDLYIGAEDIWAFSDYTEKTWWNKTNCMIWTTLDSLPILTEAVSKASSIKNYYVWASFAEKALHELGHDHVKTLHGSIDCSTFFKLKNEERKSLRVSNNIHPDSYIIGFVFRNQLRKSVPNILEGFNMFIKQEPDSNARLLLHTHWAEGWDIPRILKEKKIDPNLILTTYFCQNCGSYEVRPFTGQDQQCRSCGSKKSNTTNTTHGVSEAQLNEIYNLMDVYCHPFTSGGQEIPIQEAKLTELITLVTDYSCGTDSCNAQSGGLPLEWSEYREPGTQFIKASTYASSISKGLKKVFKMNPEKKAAREKKSRKYVLNNYDTQKIGAKLENIIDKMPEVLWDFDLSFIRKDENYTPPEIEGNPEWVIDLYKNILKRQVDERDLGVQHWLQRLSSDMKRNEVLEYFKSVAVKENNENNKTELKDLLEENGKNKALMISSSDMATVFAATSLFESFHETYPNTDLYFACHPQFAHILNGNTHVKKVIPFHNSMNDEFLMIGRGSHDGYFDYHINLNNSHIKNISSKNCYEFR
jgi:glycosyltransferase involved in cell wall biosynthesis